jgi:hypothetical protein
MAGLDWFELDVDFHGDPKVRALASRLREPLADSYVSRLYAYCYKHAVDRFDPLAAAETIEEAVHWRGRRGVLFDALFAVEVLERDAGKVIVHGVAARLGPHLAHRDAAAARQRKRRDKAAKTLGRPDLVTAPVPRDVPRDDARDVTAWSRVSHGRTGQGQGREETRAASSAAPGFIRPIAVHLAGQCPDLATALKGPRSR